MNIRELDRLIARLQEEEGNEDLILFYQKKRVVLLHEICDKLNKELNEEYSTDIDR